MPFVVQASEGFGFLDSRFEHCGTSIRTLPRAGEGSRPAPAKLDRSLSGCLRRMSCSNFSKGGAFMGEQPAFAVDTAAIARKACIRADHPVAWNDDGNWVRPIKAPPFEKLLQDMRR